MRRAKCAKRARSRGPHDWLFLATRRAALHALFAYPISGDIDSKIVKAALEELCAQASHGGRVHLAAALKKFPREAGVDPARDYPLSMWRICNCATKKQFRG